LSRSSAVKEASLMIHSRKLDPSRDFIPRLRVRVKSDKGTQEAMRPVAA
jgi:hypothetical protein